MADAYINVELVYAEPERQLKIPLQVPATASVGDAISLSGILPELPQQVAENLQVGVFGKLCGLEQNLQEADRIEIYRPLLQDPKEARRQRASKTQPTKPIRSR